MDKVVYGKKSLVPDCNTLAYRNKLIRMKFCVANKHSIDLCFSDQHFIKNEKDVKKNRTVRLFEIQPRQSFFPNYRQGTTEVKFNLRETTINAKNHHHHKKTISQFYYKTRRLES